MSARFLLLGLALAALAGCGARGGDASAQAPDRGANPQLVAPQTSLVPTVNQAHAVGWPAGAAPMAPAGFVVTRFAEDIAHPRWIYVLPNGDVLVAQSSSKPSHGGGFVGWVRNQVQNDAGALALSPDRITLLRDSNGDGVVDTKGVFAENLNQPFGMALLNGWFYVGNTDSVVRFAYAPNATSVVGAHVILRLPYSTDDDGHWTRNIVARPDGAKLYVGVGSATNIADNGMGAERGRAAIWEFNPDGSGARIYASGLRNPNGMDFEPTTGALWVAVNERDMLGDETPPDYMTAVRENGFYGWPYSYWGQHVDTRVRPPRPDLVATALQPDYALGAHTASLGLVFYRGAAFPAHYRGGVFIGQHGSWNRSQHVGYEVAFVPFANGRPSGPMEDFLTGFLNAQGQAQGRPVGVAVDRTGALLVADDVGNVIWRVAPAH